MSDIVERLREENWWLNVSGDEAANEIDRLHAHLQHYRELADQLRAEIERLKAEIERLKADPDPGQRIWDDGYAAGKAASMRR